jgi:3',5'-cyclic AMP phosphodiesterase CpdA
MLAHYRATYSPQDYSSFDTKHATFVMLDSEMLILPFLGLNGTTDPAVLTEAEAQWGFAADALAAASASGRLAVVVMHHPPFLHTEDEAHQQYYNMPLEPRGRMLALARRYGVKWFLCGHTHTTTSRTTADGITIETTAGTAKAFDHNGCGYRKLTITAAGSLTSTYVELPGGGGAPGCAKGAAP